MGYSFLATVFGNNTISEPMYLAVVIVYVNFSSRWSSVSGPWIPEGKEGLCACIGSVQIWKRRLRCVGSYFQEGPFPCFMSGNWALSTFSNAFHTNNNIDNRHVNTHGQNDHVHIVIEKCFQVCLDMEFKIIIHLNRTPFFDTWKQTRY